MSGTETVSSGSVTASSRTVTGWSSLLVTVAENRPLPLDRMTALGAATLTERSRSSIQSRERAAEVRLGKGSRRLA